MSAIYLAARSLAGHIHVHDIYLTGISVGEDTGEVDHQLRWNANSPLELQAECCAGTLMLQSLLRTKSINPYQVNCAHFI